MDERPEEEGQDGIKAGLHGIWKGRVKSGKNELSASARMN
jgi:hypothetical protein